MSSSTSGRADPLLLLEVALLLALFGLAVALYWIPAADNEYRPGWWTPALLVGLALTVLLVEVFRRRRRRHADLHRGIREDVGSLDDEQLPRHP